ncbi:MAG: transglutaminaseTgpA domain-containing protein, partial [bacterium]|nr:transglutaminaseTgpA domain-containing protein [bacterium]
MRPTPQPPPPSLPAEFLLVGVSVTTLLSGLRLFSDGSFLPPVIGATLLTHVLVAVVRRAGRSIGLGALVSLVGVAALQLWVHYPHTTRFGLPQRATLEALSDDFRGAWDLVNSSQVPVAAQTALVVIAAAVAWVIPVLADWGAFRVGVRGEALVPAAMAFVAVSLFGTDEGRILYPLLVVICAVAFGLVHHRSQRPARRDLGGGERLTHRGPLGLAGSALAVTGATLATVVLLPALSDGPLRPLLDPAAAPAEGERKVVLSPLVVLPGQLLQNPHLELFSVRSTQRAYWRLTALGDFDGVVWSLDERTATATGALASRAATTGPVSEVTQTYRIDALAAVWLPAAYQPVGFEAAGNSFRASFEPVSSTLLVGSSRGDSDGLSYTVRSAVPRFEADFLASLRNDPADVPPGFTDLPAGLSPALAELAAEVTAGRAGPYQKALAMQDWFRSRFEYDLDVAAGHSSARLEDFLLEDRRGYCEQFAAAFATLARTLGLPARVAVGFTPGIEAGPEEGDGALYSVRGEHAHAWPEVFISGAGWVAFEPTPGRGAPGAEDYTFVPEQQDAPGPPTTPTLAPPQPPQPQPPSGAPPPPGSPAAPDGGGDVAGTAGRVGVLFGLAAAGLAAAGGGYALATAGLRSVRRRRR